MTLQVYSKMLNSERAPKSDDEKKREEEEEKTNISQHETKTLP